MKRLILIVAVLTLTGCAANAQSGAVYDPKETKDSFDSAAMNKMVAGPLELVERGDLAGAETRFAALKAGALRRQGASSLDAADLEMAFGVELYVAAKDAEDAETGTAALRHLSQSVDQYARHFGRVHPETALALTSLADAMGGLSNEGRIEERLLLIRESLEIRSRTLGWANIETVANARSLATLTVEQDPPTPESLAQSLANLERAIRSVPATVPVGNDESREVLDITKARVLLRLDRGDEAVTIAKGVIAKLLAGSVGGEYCFGLRERIDDLRKDLVNRGDQARAERLGDPDAVVCDTSPIEELLKELLSKGD